MKILIIVILANLFTTAAIAETQSTGPNDMGPNISDGRSDYRYVASRLTLEDLSKDPKNPLSYCAPLSEKYVIDHAYDKSLAITPGSEVNIFLKNAYFSRASGTWGRLPLLGDRKSDIGVLMNTSVNAPYTKKNRSDYGKLIYYQEEQMDKTNVNSSFLPAATIATSSDFPVLTLDISVIRFEGKTSILEKNLFKQLTHLGASFVNYPIAGEVLDSLGATIGAVNSSGDLLTSYRIGFLLGNISRGISQPILREGDFVLITTKNKRESWEELHYDHRSGILYTEPTCKVPKKGVDYLVFTVRQNLFEMDKLPSETFQDVIDKVASAEGGSAAAAKAITSIATDALKYREAKKNLEKSGKSTRDPERSLFLQRLYLSVSCGAAGNEDGACTDLSLTQNTARLEIERRIAALGYLCPDDIVTLRTAGYSVDNLVGKTLDLMNGKTTCD